MIKLHNPNYVDTNDTKTLLDHFSKNKEGNKRDPLFVLDYEDFKRKNKLDEFEKKLIANLPHHIGTYSRFNIYRSILRLTTIN